MDKLKLQSANRMDEAISAIQKLFPHVITEVESGLDRDDLGNTKPKFKKAIDFDLLRQTLSDTIVEDDAERYRLDWPGKKASLLRANTPIQKTLRPAQQESVDWEKTENLYIEGDNLEALKILQESYLGKVKMIYIDPPYNTGNDFIYKDDFKISREDYEDEIGLENEEGEKLFRNTDSNGRFHSDWLSMMYERLILARDFLREDGVIFISIDDNEVHNLRKICDEIFGEENFVGSILWKKKTNGNNMGLIPPVHDYFVCYSRDIELIDNSQFGFPIPDEEFQGKFSNPDNDINGSWTTMDLSANHKGPSFGITNQATKEVHFPPKGRYWVFNEQEVMKRINDGRIIFGKRGTGKPVQKIYARERINTVKRAESWWDKNGMNEDATVELFSLFNIPKIFDHSKPFRPIKDLVTISSSSSDIILDFFSGSATTAHAVMQLNAEDGGNRKFILVQLPEKTDESSEAYKAGFTNIAEIGKERIRRAAKKIREDLEARNASSGKKGKKKEGIQDDLLLSDESASGETEEPIVVDPNRLDLGFRVFKVDDSNMKDVFYNPGELSQDSLYDLRDNIKEDRTVQDILTQVMLDLGLILSLPIEEKELDTNTVFYVDTNALVACFDSKIDFKIVDEIARVAPLRVVFRDSCFAADKDRINVEERFKRLSPSTKVMVI